MIDICTAHESYIRATKNSGTPCRLENISVLPPRLDGAHAGGVAAGVAHPVPDDDGRWVRGNQPEQAGGRQQYCGQHLLTQSVHIPHIQPWFTDLMAYNCGVG